MFIIQSLTRKYNTFFCVVFVSDPYFLTRHDILTSLCAVSTQRNILKEEKGFNNIKPYKPFYKYMVYIYTETVCSIRRLMQT